MSESIFLSGITKEEKYQSLLPQLKALVEGETDTIANIANIIAALKYGMDFFWVGVYFVNPSPALPEGERERQLVLGPFQGTVACTRIGYGKGVCGAAWKNKETIIVQDVEKFPGHIACSALSKSEIVLPAFDKSNSVFLILDVDSDQLSAFDETDKKYLQQVIEIIQNFS